MTSLIKILIPIILIIILFFYFKANWKPINLSKSDSYYKTLSGKIYYSPMGNTFSLGKTEIKDADKNTFEILSREYAKDVNNLYYKSFKVDGVDINSFYIDNNNLAKDKNYLYEATYEGLFARKEIDKETYQHYKENIWKDKSSYFQNYKKLEVDYNSFEILNFSFCKDTNNIFSRNSSFEKVDINYTNMKVINDFYIRDNVYIYSTINEVLVKIKANSFDDLRILSSRCLTVDNKVILQGELFKYDKVDANSFEYLDADNPNITKDKNNVYYNSEIIIGANSETFRNFEYLYYTDKNNVYWKNELLQGANPKTFKRIGFEDVIECIYGDDLGNRYKLGKKQE